MDRLLTDCLGQCQLHTDINSEYVYAIELDKLHEMFQKEYFSVYNRNQRHSPFKLKCREGTKLPNPHILSFGEKVK